MLQEIFSEEMKDYVLHTVKYCFVACIKPTCESNWKFIFLTVRLSFDSRNQRTQQFGKDTLLPLSAASTTSWIKYVLYYNKKQYTERVQLTKEQYSEILFTWLLIQANKRQVGMDTLLFIDISFLLQTLSCAV